MAGHHFSVSLSACAHRWSCLHRLCRDTTYPACKVSKTMATARKRKRHRFSATTATAFLPPPTTATSMDEAEGEKKAAEADYDHCYYYPVVPTQNRILSFFTTLLSFQAEIICSCFAALLSPFFSFLSFIYESVHRVEEAEESVRSGVHAAARLPSIVARGSIILVRKILMGILGAVYVCMVLTVVMALAIVIGVGSVQMYVEEPVVVNERLYFDYTNIHPEAIFSFGGGEGAGSGGFGGYYQKQKQKTGGVPVGHTFSVYLVLLLPESDYNREIGVFQVTAELISSKGDAIAKSSQPCMLRFRSLPIRLMRTFLMGVPLLLGLTDETQKMTIPILRHREGYPMRTRAIKVSLIPRAGTSYVPQLYEAEIVVNSQLPWRKEIVRRWKWTFYVWTSLYVYIVLLVILVCWFRQLVFPTTTNVRGVVEHYRRRCRHGGEQEESMVEVSSKEAQERSRSSTRAGEENREISESLRRWRENRSRRKAMLLQETAGGSSASSISLTREETVTATYEDAGDSESICGGA